MKVRGQITIVDLNDARSIHASITCNSPLVLVYDSGTESYSPDFTTSNATFSPAIYMSGSANNLALGSDVTSIVWRVDGNTPSGIFTTSGKNLKLTGNLTENSYRIEYTAIYKDPDTNVETTVTATTTMSKIASGTPGVTYTIVVPEGPDFSTHGKSVIHAVPLFYKGGNRLELTATDTTWYKCLPSEDGSTPDGTNDGWLLITATSDTEDSTAWVSTYNMEDDDPTVYSLVLYITPSAVDSFETFKCEVQDDSTVYEEYIIVSDRTDAYLIEIFSPTGDKVLNGIEGTDIYAKVYCNGENVTDLFNFDWYFYDKVGDRIMDSTNPANPKVKHGETSPLGNKITLSHTEIDRKITVLCEATKK